MSNANAKYRVWLEDHVAALLRRAEECESSYSAESSLGKAARKMAKWHREAAAIYQRELDYLPPDVGPECREVGDGR